MEELDVLFGELRALIAHIQARGLDAMGELIALCDLAQETDPAYFTEVMLPHLISASVPIPPPHAPPNEDVFSRVAAFLEVHPDAALALDLSALHVDDARLEHLLSQRWLPQLMWAELSCDHVSQAYLERFEGALNPQAVLIRGGVLECLRRAHPRHRAGDFSALELSEAKLAGADLSGTNLEHTLLEGADLAGADLTHARMVGANLAAARLEDARCTSCVLSGAFLLHAELARADLSEANLSGANLSRADLESASLVGANLEGALLSEARLQDADFRGADLRRAHLDMAILYGACFLHADLDGVLMAGAHFDETTQWPEGFELAQALLRGQDMAGDDLSGEDLSHARLPRADLSRANLSEATLAGTQLPGANLSHANLRWAHLRDADLAGADLSHSDLSGARFEHVDLHEANLTSADLTGVNMMCVRMCGADLSGAQLQQATLDWQGLTHVRYDARTQWPDVPTPPRASPLSQAIHLEQELRRALGRDTAFVSWRSDVSLPHLDAREKAMHLLREHGLGVWALELRHRETLAARLQEKLHRAGIPMHGASAWIRRFYGWFEREYQEDTRWYEGFQEGRELCVVATTYGGAALWVM